MGGFYASLKVGKGISLAIFRRFWAVAARVNSARAVWASQTQPVEFEDALEVREQHLDLFAEPP